MNGIAPIDLSWDLWYLGIAKYVSTKSKDPSTKTGAVIVRPDKSLCSVGFNGFPQKMPDLPELYENRDEKYSRIIHCEMNAMMFSRDATLQGYTVYTWPFISCDRCFEHLAQKGVVRFVAPQATPEQLVRWAEPFAKTKKYATEMGLTVVEVPREMLEEQTGE